MNWSKLQYPGQSPTTPEIQETNISPAFFLYLESIYILPRSNLEINIISRNTCRGNRIKDQVITTAPFSYRLKILKVWLNYSQWFILSLEQQYITECDFVPKNIWPHLETFFKKSSPKICSLILEREIDRERVRETLFVCLPYTPQLGIEPTT